MLLLYTTRRRLVNYRSSRLVFGSISLGNNRLPLSSLVSFDGAKPGRLRVLLYRTLQGLEVQALTEPGHFICDRNFASAIIIIWQPVQEGLHLGSDDSQIRSYTKFNCVA